MQFQKGTKTTTVDPLARVRIFSTSEFICYGKTDGKRTGILGPPNSTVRTWTFQLPAEYNGVEIKTEKTTEWSLDWIPTDKKETPDPTPVETSLEPPLTLREEMKRFITSELSRVADTQELHILRD